MLKMFPNISSLLEQILILRISVTAELTVLFLKGILHLVKCAGNENLMIKFENLRSLTSFLSFSCLLGIVAY